MDNLIAEIRRRIKERATDMGGASAPILRTASASDIASDERKLGCELPPLMRRIYTEIGNGGIGPGYGLIGLTGGVPDDTGNTIPELYESLRIADPEDLQWQWPEKLLPICHWGCAIYSCVDCADPRFRMQVFDPNVHGDGSWEDSFFEEAGSFDAWMEAWASGVDLWALMYGEGGEISAILSARQS